MQLASLVRFPESRAPTVLKEIAKGRYAILLDSSLRTLDSDESNYIVRENSGFSVRAALVRNMLPESW